MKILKIIATNFLLCEDNFTINYVPIANKDVEDKEYELQEIDENLYTFNTIAFVGKNASGKTTAIRLLTLVFDIISSFQLKSSFKTISDTTKPVNITIFFYYEGNIYKYIFDLTIDKLLNQANFNNEKVFIKKYDKYHSSKIFDEKTFSLMKIEKDLPNYMSILYKIYKDNGLIGISYSCAESESWAFSEGYKLFEFIQNKNIIKYIIKLCDNSIKKLEKKDNDNYLVENSQGEKEMTQKELIDILSSGTIKGITLFPQVVFSLLYGIDLSIDEIENHFHKTLAESIILLYKDKCVNKKNATLTFSTHYSELTDLFKRSDNIYIMKHEEKIRAENMYNYKIRPDLLKSKKYYQNSFGTDVDYETLMALKKELMK